MTSQLQIPVRPSNYVYRRLMSHGTTCGKRGRIFGSILYQIVSCITEYLEFRQFVQNALLVDPLLRVYLRGGGGGHGFLTATEQLLECPPPHGLVTASEQVLECPAARAPGWACISSIDKCDLFHIPSLENSVLLTPVNAPSFQSEYTTRPKIFLSIFKAIKCMCYPILGPSVDRNRNQIVSYSVVTYLPFHLSEA